MECMVIAIGSPNMFRYLLTGILGVTNDVTLPFNPFKTAFLSVGFFSVSILSSVLTTAHWSLTDFGFFQTLRPYLLVRCICWFSLLPILS